MDGQSTSGKPEGRPPPQGEHAGLHGAAVPSLEDQQVQLQDAYELLGARQYERVEQLLLERQEAARRSGQMAVVVILAAACQLCLTCRQFYADRELHQLGLEEAARRERESRLQIRAVLTMLSQLSTLESYAKAKTTPSLPSALVGIGEPAKTISDDKPTIVRRLKRLLGMERTPPPDKSEVDFELDLASSPTHVDMASTLEQLAGEAKMSDEGFASSEAQVPFPQAGQEQIVDDREDAGLEDVRESEQARPTPFPETSPLRPEEVSAYEQLSQPSLVFHCLGPFQVYANGKPIERWPSGKGKSIFKYLVINRERPTAKEVLMELFWPEFDPQAARNNLNVAIYGLRQAFREGGADFSYVLYQSEHYLVNPEVEIWSDVEEFMARYQNGRRLQREGLERKAVREYHAAEALYQGEFLAEDRYEDWLIPMRQSLQEAYLDVLARLSDHYFAGDEYATCVSLCRQMLDVEPCQEASHACLMRCYCRLGQHFLAIRQYHQCIRCLAEELDVSPSPETTELYEQVRQHKLGEPPVDPVDSLK